MSDFKTINIGNAGTSTKFGGNDLDIIGNMLNGQVAAIPDVKIKSTNDWGFWDNVLYIRNQADTQQTTIRGGVTTGSFDLFIPPLTQNDTLAALGLTQIFSAVQRFEKGIVIPQQAAPTGPDLPGALTNQLFFDALGHLSSVNSAGTVTDYTASVGPGHHTAHEVGGADPFSKTSLISGSTRYIAEEADPASDSRRIWINVNTKTIEYWDNQTVPAKQVLEIQSNKGAVSGYCDLDASSLVPLSRLGGIVDANIGAHTSSKITIASRSLLPALLAYEDETNIFSVVQKFDVGGVKLKPITTPGTDAAYGIVFVDSADGLIKFKRASGTVDNLSSTANAPTAATYLTISNDATLTNERAIAASDGIQFLDNGANSTLVIEQDVIDMARKTVHFIDDFFGDSSTGGTFFQRSVSGTGADITNLGVSELGIYGAWQLTTGTTTTGRSAIFSGNQNSFSLGQGVAIFEGYVKVPTLSTVGEEFIVRIGFLDSNSGGPTDGVYFIYDRLTSVNWRIGTTQAGTPTTSNSTTAVGTSWVRLKIVVNAAGTSASFFVNGTEVSGSPITTNIPVGAGNNCTVIASIVKSAGTTARTFNMDYIALEYDLTSSR